MATLHVRMPSAQYYRSNDHTSHIDSSMPFIRPKPTVQVTGNRDDGRDGPWQGMTETYVWVVEQEIRKVGPKRAKKTEQWIREQQIFIPKDPVKPSGSGAGGDKIHRSAREGIAYPYVEIEAERWMRHEEEARRRALERERVRTRLVQEEIRRVEARIRQKREEERENFAKERARMRAEAQDREKQRREMEEKQVAEAWSKYETRWKSLAADPEPLRFSNIPWPLAHQPTRLEEITPKAIIGFLFSQGHSQTQSRRDRLRSAQLRWHPDRFRRLLGKVADEDKSKVEEAVGIVARCLNDAAEQEKQAPRHAGWQ